MSAAISFKSYPFDELSLAPNPRPRESISAASIEEMASSILQQGIIQPLLARLVEGVPQVYAGQRRFLGFERARQRSQAGESLGEGVDLSVVPVLLREIDDHQMREHQWIENLQRVDVHPRDEAVGYAELRDLFGYTMQDISRKIGKADEYVAHRLVLLKVPDLLWKAMDEGKVTISHLEIAGSVPNEKDREEFGKLVIAGQYGDRVMTVKEAQELKNARFAVSLRACGFDKKDAKLVQLEHKDGVRVIGGACVGCEYMTGSAKALTCSNVRCFYAKQNEHWKVIKANAENLGKRCMDVDQTEQLFNSWGDRILREDRGLVDLGASPSYMELGHYNDNEDDVPTWEALLEDTDAMSMAITARHPKTNRVHQLLEREDAIRLAIEKDASVAKLFENRPGVKKKKPVPTGDDGGADADDGDDDEEGDGEQPVDAERIPWEKKRQINEIRDRTLYDEFARCLRAKKWSDGVKLTLVKLAAHAALANGTAEVVLMTGADKSALDDSECKLANEWAVLGPLIEPELKADDTAWLRWMAMFAIVSETGYESFENWDGVKELAGHLGIDIDGIAQKAHEAVMSPAKEVLFDCDKCGGKNFTEKGLKAHKCEKRQAKQAAKASEEGAEPPWAEAEPVERTDRFAAEEEITGVQASKLGKINDEVKADARKLYDEGKGKGTIAKILKISENTVGNWQKREWPKRSKG